MRWLARVTRGRTFLRAGIALVPCLIAVWFARLYILDFNDPSNYYPPFTDAVTYLGAGERLNAGHDLYVLSQGDRLVALEPGLSPAALLSPPPIAVIWRPLALGPLGFAAWLIAGWIALLAAGFYVAFRGGLIGVMLALLLSRAMGEQIAVGNVAAFFPALMIAAWRLRQHRAAGVIVGTLASIKLAPISLIGWLVGTRSTRIVVAALLVLAGWATASILGSGAESMTEYLSIAGAIRPSPMSLAGRTGIPWLSVGALIALTLASAAISRRWPAAGFAVAVAASVFGTPALYTSGWVTLLAIAAPLTDLPPQAWRPYPFWQGRFLSLVRRPGFIAPGLSNSRTPR
jgi:hypothetical protein